MHHIGRVDTMHGIVKNITLTHIVGEDSYMYDVVIAIVGLPVVIFRITSFEEKLICGLTTIGMDIDLIVVNNRLHLLTTPRAQYKYR